MIRPVSHVAAMVPYALADLAASDGKPLISLSQNESLRPPSPRAVDAAAAAMARAHLYPDPEWRDLCRALSSLHAIPAAGILCANGSMELIAGIALSFADETGAVLAPANAYPFFRTVAALARARFDTAPEDAGCVSVDALLAAVRPDTRIVFVANPGNPTGTRIPLDDIKRLRRGLPEGVLLVIDEAYGEFADHLGESAFDQVAGGRTVVLRTFSKAYGLAGMRVGWGLFPPDVAEAVRKVLNPNNVSVAGQAAALAAVEDQSYMRATCSETKSLQDGFIHRLRSAGFDVAESFTNFVLVRFQSAGAAKAAEDALRAESIFVRAQGGAGLSACLRVTVADAEKLDHVVRLLRQRAGEGQV